MRRPLPLLLAMATAAVAILVLAGPAAASGTVTCPPDDGTDLQNAINGGGTVTINGTCHGNFVVVGGSVTLQGGSPGATLDGDGLGSVLTIVGATVTIRNLTITDGSADEGGGIDAIASLVNVIASRITANHADDAGGGVFALVSILTLTNSSVRDNNSSNVGGGIAVVVETILNMTGTTVERNVAESEDGAGGGLFVDDASIAAIDSSTFSTNQATNGGGGGIESFFSNVQLTNSRLLFNKAFLYGGGIEFGDSFPEEGLPGSDPNPAAAVKGAAAGRHGPSWVLPASLANKVPVHRAPLVTSVPVGLTITNSMIDHNTAQLAGGGGVSTYAAEFDTPTTITNSVLSNNQAPGFVLAPTGGGGGFEQDSGDVDTTASLVVTGSKLYGNTAAHTVGGGIANWDDGFGEFGTAEVSLATTSFANPNSLQVGNTSSFGGGIYNAGLNASASLGSGTKLIRNKATVNGGGVYNDCAASLFVSPGVVLLSNIPNNIVLSPGCLIF